MKIFVFKNIIGNYLSGDFYFIAKDRERALKLALDFQEEQNIRTQNNQNYMIEFDQEDYQEYDLDEGFIPLNRVYLPVER